MKLGLSKCIPWYAEQDSWRLNFHLLLDMDGTSIIFLGAVLMYFVSVTVNSFSSFLLD